jgi:5-carboxymethyl-2-hydroxymuconate isomerase
LCAFRSGGRSRAGLVRDESILPLEGEDVGAVLAGAPRPSRDPLVPLAEAELLAPLRPRTIFGVGHNYRDHAAEMAAEPPPYPRIFLKAPGAVAPPSAPVPVPGYTDELDYEGELAVVIGSPARDLPPERALDAVFGYAIMDDVSARDRQRDEPQWLRAKGGDGFAPFGPWITTADEVPDPQDLRIRTWVDDELRQDASTGLMVFSVADLVSWLSRHLTLSPGDVIATGTPAGVGAGMRPARYLGPGATVSIEIERLGRISHRIG